MCRVIPFLMILLACSGGKSNPLDAGNTEPDASTNTDAHVSDAGIPDARIPDAGTTVCSVFCAAEFACIDANASSCPKRFDKLFEDCSSSELDEVAACSTAPLGKQCNSFGTCLDAIPCFGL